MLQSFQLQPLATLAYLCKIHRTCMLNKHHGYDVYSIDDWSSLPSWGRHKFCTHSTFSRSHLLDFIECYVQLGGIGPIDFWFLFDQNFQGKLVLSILFKLIKLQFFPKFWLLLYFDALLFLSLYYVTISLLFAIMSALYLHVMSYLSLCDLHEYILLHSEII